MHVRGHSWGKSLAGDASSGQANPLRLGLIGAGFIGKVHAGCIAQNHRARLAGVFDVNRAAAEAAAQGEAKIAKTADQLIEDPAVDAVIIASSTDTHGELARKAIAQGKAFLCEKPLDRTLASAVETVRRAQASGVLAGMAFNRRFDRQHALLRRAVVEGEVGDIEMMHLTSRSQSPPDMDYARHSGGMLRDKGAHFFDLCCWIAQDRPVKVYAQGACLFEPRLAEFGDVDTAMIVLEMSRGALCHLNFSRRTAYGYDERIEVFGSRGRIDSGAPLPLDVSRYIGTTVIREGLHQNWFDRIAPTYSTQLAAFIDALEGRGGTFPSVQDGLLAESIAEAAQKSMETGLRVEIPIEGEDGI
jgi:myo-inositol 2-dehydrogenase / D-chiro-inositol 1-dehydrogenase